MNVAGLVMAGFVFAAIFCIGWAASMMSARDWGYLLGLSALFTLLIYGRGWLRAIMGLATKTTGAKGKDDVVYICPVCRCAHHRPNEFCSCACCHSAVTSHPSPPSRDPVRPLILSLHDSGALKSLNGVEPHHHNKEPLTNPPQAGRLRYP